MQDPLHYPHGTKFMAPGPMGQCFPVPDDDAIKQQMMTTAENAEKIYRMYNFDYNTKVRQCDMLPSLKHKCRCFASAAALLLLQALALLSCL